MCDVDKTCYKRLWDVNAMESCITPQNSPMKSLYIDQSLSFKPTDYERHSKMADNYTYSVYMSSDFLKDDVRLVPGCCNLDNRKNDTCRMPAISDKNIRFFVVFPYREGLGRPSIYCRMKVPYADSPVEFCVDGEEIIDPCLELSEDGFFIIKYRYTPLSGDIRRDTAITTRCYFPLSADIMPSNKTYPTRSITENKKGFIVMKPPDSALVRNVTEHDCTIHKNVSNFMNHLDIATDISKVEGGDFVCCGLKQLHNNSEYFLETFCTNMTQVAGIPPPVLLIVLPISAFVALLALIVCVKGCQKHGKFKKMADDWKKSPSLQFLTRQHKEGQEKALTTVKEVPKSEEFYEVVAEAEDDSYSINSKTSIPKISESEKDFNDHNLNETIAYGPTKGGGVYILKQTSTEKENFASEQLDDSGFCSGSGSDLGQYCKKSHQEITSEPTYPSGPGDSGYLTKTLTVHTPNPCEDTHTAESIHKMDAAMNCGSFNSGYTAKYIAKHNTISSDE